VSLCSYLHSRFPFPWLMYKLCFSFLCVSFKDTLIFNSSLFDMSTWKAREVRDVPRLTDLIRGELVLARAHNRKAKAAKEAIVMKSTSTSSSLNGVAQKPSCYSVVWMWRWFAAGSPNERDDVDAVRP
jgi:hypothetical protein